MKDPETPAEWQEAVDVATFLLALESCRRYGLLNGTPEALVPRCEEIVDRGSQLGFFPRPMEKLIEEFLGPSV